MRSSWNGWSVMVAAGFAALGASPSADACGAFVPREGTVPSPRIEEVVILHDERLQIEHFVREVAFHQVGSPFAFVIPTPGRPEIEPVKDRPFATLQA